MRKPKLFQSAPQREGNQNAFRGGAYSIVVTAVVLAILVAVNVFEMCIRDRSSMVSSVRANSTKFLISLSIRVICAWALSIHFCSVFG